MLRRRAPLACSAIVLTLTLASCGSPERPQVSASTSTVGPTTTVVSTPPTTVVATEPVTTQGTMVARANGSELIAYAAPDETSEPVAQLDNPIPSGGALVLRVLSPVSAAQDPWLEVMLPVRPNGTTGWIRSDEVDLSVNPYRIEISASDFSLDLYEQNELVMSTTIAVGTGDTPTPFGEFYLAELLRPPDPNGSYGPYAFGLSGFSEVLDSFNGGDGVVGIHGTNQPEALGTTVSHGCVRVQNEVIEEMAATVPLGTPVTITR